MRWLIQPRVIAHRVDALESAGLPGYPAAVCPRLAGSLVVTAEVTTIATTCARLAQPSLATSRPRGYHQFARR
jgi:hypothetical protein